MLSSQDLVFFFSFLSMIGLHTVANLSPLSLSSIVCRKSPRLSLNLSGSVLLVCVVFCEFAFVEWWRGTGPDCHIRRSSCLMLSWKHKGLAVFRVLMWMLQPRPYFLVVDPCNSLWAPMENLFNSVYSESLTCSFWTCFCLDSLSVNGITSVLSHRIKNSRNHSRHLHSSVLKQSPVHRIVLYCPYFSVTLIHLLITSSDASPWLSFSFSVPHAGRKIRDKSDHCHLLFNIFYVDPSF